MKPHYADDSVTLYAGDCLDVLAELPDNSVDAVVTDPPYGLGFMGREWDDLPPGVPFAAECLRVLKPGGHMLAFGGSRTWHRLACAIEDAGFEVRDSIAWLYGSGFPKSLDVSKAIDRANGKHNRDLGVFGAYVRERRRAKGWSLRQLDEAMGTNTAASWWEGRKSGVQPPSVSTYQRLKRVLDMSDMFDELIEWAEAEREKVGERGVPVGHAFAGATYGGDSSDHTVDVTAPATDDARKWQGWGTALKPAFEPIVVARKPLSGTVAANVLEHGTGAINVDGCRVGKDERVNPAAGNKPGGASLNMSAVGMPQDATATIAAGRWPPNVVLDGHAADELDKQAGIRTSGANPTRRGADGDRTVLGDFAGQDDANPRRGADSGGASRFFPTFRYQPKAGSSERPRADDIAHPTVKPLDLMRWLVRLVTPPGGTVLEPFAGSGTTAEACVIEGFNCIAIERDETYLPLIVARLTKPIQVGLDFGDTA